MSLADKVNFDTTENVFNSLVMVHEAAMNTMLQHADVPQGVRALGEVGLEVIIKDIKEAWAEAKKKEQGE